MAFVDAVFRDDIDLAQRPSPTSINLQRALHYVQAYVSADAPDRALTHIGHLGHLSPELGELVAALERRRDEQLRRTCDERLRCGAIRAGLEWYLPHALLPPSDLLRAGAEARFACGDIDQGIYALYLAIEADALRAFGGKEQPSSRDVDQAYATAARILPCGENALRLLAQCLVEADSAISHRPMASSAEDAARVVEDYADERTSASAAYYLYRLAGKTAKLRRLIPRLLREGAWRPVLDMIAGGAKLQDSHLRRLVRAVIRAGDDGGLQTLLQTCGPQLTKDELVALGRAAALRVPFRHPPENASSDEAFLAAVLRGARVDPATLTAKLKDKIGA